MKRMAFSLLISLAFAVVALGQLPDGTCKVYSGILGQSTGIGMSLFVQSNTIEGAYFYRKYLTDIPLKGTSGGARDITLQETDPAGTSQGIFQLHLAEHDPRYAANQPLQGEVLQGTWISADGTKTYPVKLRLDHSCSKLGGSEYGVAGAEDDTLVERNVQAFYEAVLAGKRADAAKYVSYPCTFFRDGKRVSVEADAEFLKNYDAIFTKAFVAKIATGTPHHMFANDRGIMIADGAVWFDAQGKARNFNNSPIS
jgi:hypothetical protein